MVARAALLQHQCFSRPTLGSAPRPTRPHPPSRDGQRRGASSGEHAEGPGSCLPSDRCLSRRVAWPQCLAPRCSHSSGQPLSCPARARLLRACVRSGVALSAVNSEAAVWSPVRCLGLSQLPVPDPSTSYWGTTRGTGLTNLSKGCTPLPAPCESSPEPSLGEGSSF